MGALGQCLICELDGRETDPQAYVWTINPEGGYGRGAVYCCVPCMRNDERGRSFVPRLLEALPDDAVKTLKRDLVGE